MKNYNRLTQEKLRHILLKSIKGYYHLFRSLCRIYTRKVDNILIPPFVIRKWKSIVKNKELEEEML